MTNDHPHTHGDDLDLLASRLLDGEIDLTQIPLALRPEVERRFAAVSRLREMLRTASIDATDRDTHIAAALREASRSSRRDRRPPASSRSRFAIAASFLVVVSLSTLVIRQFGSVDDAVVFDAMPVVTEENPTTRAESSPEEPVTDNSESTGGVVTQQDEFHVNAQPQASATVPEFGTENDIATFTERMAATTSKDGIESVESTTRRCSIDSTRYVSVFGAIFAGSMVEVHVIEPGLFVVYDVVDCSIVLDRSTTETMVD